MLKQIELELDTKIVELYQDEDGEFIFISIFECLMEQLKHLPLEVLNYIIKADWMQMCEIWDAQKSIWTKMLDSDIITDELTYMTNQLLKDKAQLLVKGLK